jgi:tRNA(Arg) A34 adenosine deaminase TadA/predicted GIY-YIG superfamily endonuclease
MSFWVYMLRCSDGSYYTGHTDNLEKRIGQHHAGEIQSCYTYKRRPLTVVWTQDFSSRIAALESEMQVKRWSRAKKEALIASDWQKVSELARNRTQTAEHARSAISAEPVREERGSTSSPRTVLGEGSPMQETDTEWMRHALALADRAEREDDEIPVGAVLVGADGQLLGEGWNRNLAEHDPSAHAEIVAMRRAGLKLGNHRLVGSTLYVTLEPCAMCAMAMVHARVARLVYAASDPKTGACGSVFDLLADSRHNHRVEVASGLLAEEASKRLTNYFRAKRGKPLLD